MEEEAVVSMDVEDDFQQQDRVMETESEEYRSFEDDPEASGSGPD